MKIKQFGKAYIIPEESKIRMNYNKTLLNEITKLIENKKTEFDKKI